MSLYHAHQPKKSLMLIVGKALLFAGIQFSLGSVEMSSKFSVKNFASDQETLNNAVSALRDYIIIAAIWTLGCCLVFFSNYGFIGLGASLVANIIFVSWIYFSYYASFRQAAKKYGLQVPGLFAAK
jgi:hypothetical protein